MRFGPVGGAKKAKVVVKVAVHFGVEPDTAVQVCAVPSTVLPFMNCTVPVGLAPVPVPVTVAVKVMLPPDAMLVEELVNAVVVDTPPPLVPEKEKFKTLLPPKATGLGSRAPNELTMM
jgi:hypothetical protein